MHLRNARIFEACCACFIGMSALPSEARADPCGASHYHGFKGVEDELLATITRWIKANSPPRR